MAVGAGPPPPPPKRDPKTGRYRDAKHLRAKCRLTANRSVERWPGFLTQPRASARRKRQWEAVQRSWKTNRDRFA